MFKPNKLWGIGIITISALGFILIQLNSIKGFVGNGENPVPFAKVKIKATDNSAIADSEGNFILNELVSEDSVIVAAWAQGYFNGETKVLPGDSNVAIILHELYSDDNPNYQFISPFSIEGNELNCQNCHVETLISQWVNNAHGQSAKNPFFHSMYYGTDYEGNERYGIGFKEDFPNSFGNCATCHIPGAAINNPWGVDPKSVAEPNKNGIYCDFCHKIKDVIPNSGQGTTGTLSIEFLRPPDSMQVFFGPYIDVHEPDTYSPIISKSEFCMPCHNAKFWGVPAYQTFNEWNESIYPPMGIQCQTCHMAPDSITTNFVHLNQGGIIRDPLTIPSHSQPGSRDTIILKNSVTMTIDTHESEDSIFVQVVILNDKTGHHVPAGRPSRNMILLVEAKDETGQNLDFLSGDMVPFWGGVGSVEDGNYSGLPGKGYVKLLEDFEGNIPSPIWRPTHIVSDNRIPAMKSDTSVYVFRKPINYETIKIETKLVYRRFYKEWMDDKSFEIPDIIMEEETKTVSNISTSTKEIIQNDINISEAFPNPIKTFSHFIITSPDNLELTIQVFNMKGILVQKEETVLINLGENKINIDLSILEKGNYIFRFSNKQQVFATRKIVKYD